MGGGDLNQKKSWHPHTLKNQEKVWKAEQAKSREEQKLKDLRREIEQERDRDELKRIGQNSGVLREGNKKLEWMYKNSNELVNREEYLLGRNIDKSFEMLQAEEERKAAQEHSASVGVREPPPNHVEHECIPFSIRAYRNVESKEQVDLQRKVMEDPLMLIKQREMESRRQILENPVKLKELHRILKTDKRLTKKQKKSKKKSKKKHKSKSQSSSSESSSSDSSDEQDLDKKLAKRVKKLKGNLMNDEHEQFKGLNLSKLLDEKYEKISNELDKAVTAKRKTDKSYSRSDSEHGKTSSHRSSDKRKAHTADVQFKSNSRYVHSRNSRSRSRSRDFERYRQRRISRSRSRSRDYRKSRSRSPFQTKNHRYNSRKSRSRSRSRSQQRNHRFISKKSRSRSPILHRNQRNASRSRSPCPERKAEARNYKSEKVSHAQKSKLSAAEKEARLKEMMSNAAWREDDRTKSVQKHREEYAREEDLHKKRDFDNEFMQKEVKKAIDKQTSIGSRIRSNLNNIQRSSAMSSSFTRK